MIGSDTITAQAERTERGPDGSVTHTLPAVQRSLPTPVDFERISTLPIVQLFVVGRSGASLIHAFLDGHPEVLHVPHTFKFYDFVASHPGLLAKPSREVVETFVRWPVVAFLLDSRQSVIIGGRLGLQREIYVRFDVERLCAAFVSATSGIELTERTVFLGLVLAFGWCTGQDLGRVKIVFQHLHHGDWLFPARVLEPYNLHYLPPPPGPGSLRADKLVLSVRAPYESYLAYVKFTASHGLAEAPRLDLQQQFVRLLFQDWDRLAFAQRSGADTRVIRLEDLRKDSLGTMRGCARWLGIDDNSPCLEHLTYYGHAWHGDIFTEPRTVVHQVRPSRPIAWQERWLCDAVLGVEARRHGYRMGVTGPIKRLLLWLTVIWPAPELFELAIPDRWRRYRQAARRALTTVKFVQQIHRRWPA